MQILVINAGSSSLKFALYSTEANKLSLRLRGAVRGIGSCAVSCRVEYGDDDLIQPLDDGTVHRAALQHVLREIDRRQGGHVDAVGHRVVHGGTRFREPVLIDADVLVGLGELMPLAPLHQPIEVDLIEAVRERFPGAPQVACFDTAVHHTLPEIAARLPLPNWLWEAGIRKYGFHGLSYESVLLSQPELKQGKTVIAHLGNGASATAFQDGIAVDTTMGFTPTGGLMMGTRCGDIDPGVLIHLLKVQGVSADDLDRLVNQDSGLKGISESTSDVRALVDAADDEDAGLAIDMFCYSAAKHIAGLSAALEGLDRLVFTGGIGENAAPVRSLICRRLRFLGVWLDSSRNEANAPIISETGSRCTVHVVPTDEEALIARRTREVSHPIRSGMS